MSSVSSSYMSVPRRQYIAVDPFETNIFAYSTYVDAQFVTRGRLVVHPTANSVNCAARSILRENGKKLHDGTHPDLVDPNTGLRYTYLVGVYDVKSGISGFINPNASFFSVLNSDKSYQDDLAAYQIDASMSNTNVPGNDYTNTGNPILGPSVNTAGTITTIGFVNSAEMHASTLMFTPGYIVAGPSNLIVTGNTEIVRGAGTMLASSNITSLANIYASNGLVYGSNVTAMCNVTAGRNINASNGTITGSNLVALSNLTVNTGDVTVSAGSLILNANNSGTANMTSGGISGSFRRLTVNATACKTTSQVFLTYAGINQPGVLSSEAVSNGSFQIVSNNINDNGSVRWMVIN